MDRVACKLLNSLVPGAGIEPARPEGREILSLFKHPNYLILLGTYLPEMRLSDPFASILRQPGEGQPDGHHC